MFKVVITEKGGAQRSLDFDKNEVTIGRVQGNDIILPKGNVSKRHSRIVLKDNRFIVVDLKSTNGTYVNGRKITSPLVVKAGDKIYIGDFIMTLDENAQLQGGAPAGDRQLPPPPLPPAPGPVAGPPTMQPPPGAPAFGGPPMGGSMGPPPMAPMGGPPPMSGPPPMGGPSLSGPPMGGPSLGGPPMGGPSLSGPPMGGPSLGGPPMGGPSLGGPPMGGPSLGGPPMGGPPPQRHSAPPPPRPMGGGAPPPIQRRPPSEPPAPLPPGAAQRFDLDEEPSGETVAPTPRVQLNAPSVQPVAPAPVQQPAFVAPVAPVAPAPAPAPIVMAPAPAPAPIVVAPAPAPAPIVVAPAPAPVVAAAAAPAPRVMEARPEPAAVDPQALGPLHALLDDASIIELVVEGTRAILVDRGTGFTPAPQRFASASQVRRAAEHLLAQGGVSSSQAIEEAVLADGGHVTVIFPPVAVGGPIIEVRRTSRASVTGEGLVGQGMLSNDMLTMLRAAITLRRNVLVMGAEDSGVATLISTLAQSTDERLAVVEATPELALGSSRAMRFCAGTTSLGALIQTASRLRAERLVVDGIRGPEAREALLAMAARGGGTLVGVRAAAHAGVLEHLEALASLGSSKEGVAALIGASVHVIVRMARGTDGVRRVESIAELGTEGTVDLFEHGESGFASTGYRPSFMQG